MKIHDLPAATPGENDVLAYDTGTTNYKAKFKDFDASENNVSLSSADDPDNPTWTNFSKIESAPLRTLMTKFSQVGNNVRVIWNKLGTTTLGTTATTVTGAIAELVTKKANLASPALTGNPTAPTQAAGNNSTRLATTAFVATAMSKIAVGIDQFGAYVSASNYPYIRWTNGASLYQILAMGDCFRYQESVDSGSSWHTVYDIYRNEGTGTSTTVQSSAAQNIATSTYTGLQSVSLAPGKWILIGTVQFPSSTTGARRLAFSTTKNDGGWTVSLPGAAAQEKIQVTRVVQNGQDTNVTYWLNAWQNSGSTMSIAAGDAEIQAIRIK